jgi:ubiquinone/menaquinone biosynthesis C-methylase UbiE
LSKLKTRFLTLVKQFGRRQVPVWFDSSAATIDEFEKVGKPFKILKVFPSPFPLYDLIMGVHERASNRAALRGPILGQLNSIADVGSGTGHLLSRLARSTHEGQRIAAVDLSRRMLETSKAYLAKRHQLSSRISFHQADCRELPWPEDAVDLYVSSYLMDLLPESELRDALAEMARVLKPGGYAILVTMTTELEDIVWLRRLFYRVMNELYCLGYRAGRWNLVWRFLFVGYAPHCRPIALGRYLRETPGLLPVYTKATRVLFFPVRIYYVRKDHA